MRRRDVRSPLPVVIVGAGLMGTWHARAAVRAGGRPVAVVDAEIERARRLAAQFPDCVSAAAFDRLPPDVEARVVHICTPAETHDALARASLARGAHVLVEKPIAPTPAEAATLLQAAAGAGRLLCPVHQCVLQRGVRDIAARRTGLGEILHIDAVVCSAGAEGRSAMEADRIAVEILPHPLSVVERLAPGTLERLRWHGARPQPGEWRASGAGAAPTVSVTVSMYGRPAVHEMTIVGTRGTAHIDLFHGFATIESGKVSRARKIGRPFDRAVTEFVAAGANLAGRAAARQAAYPGLWELVEAFYNAATGDGVSPISPAETMAVARATEAICRSPSS